MRFLLIICFSVLFASASAHSSEHSLGDEASAIKAAGKTYHQSVSMIRKMHPEFLNHKRDKTLRQGVRTKENSLKGCVNCHASKDETTSAYHPVDAQDQFCSTCHQQVSVSVDCFGCHRTTPSKATIQQKALETPLLPIPLLPSASVSVTPSQVTTDKQDVIATFSPTATVEEIANEAIIDNKEVDNE